MAKKRRRPRNRPHAQPPSRGAIRTAERPEEAERADKAAGHAERPHSRSTRPAQARGQEASSRSRAEKKELARQQREAVRRRVKRAERARQLLWVGAIAALIAVGVLWFTKSEEPATRPAVLPGELTTQAPWDANAAQSADRADAIGLPAEGVALHEHADVQVFVHGVQQSVPESIGISGAGATSLHTHTSDGLVHIESSDAGHTFTLGEFLDVWGVRLSATCLGGYCRTDADTLQVFKDGQEVTGSIRDIVLDNESVIVLTYGTADEVPDPLPTFDFSSIQA